MFSIGQLQMMFKDYQCKVFHDKKGLLMTYNMANNRIFVVKATPVVSACFQVTNEDTTDLCIGHMGTSVTRVRDSLSRKRW